MLINLTVRKTKKLIKKSKYKSLIEDKNGNIYWCNFDKVEKIRETTELDFTRKDFSEYFNYWNKSMCVFDRPNVRYTPKIVWKQYPKYKGE